MANEKRRLIDANELRQTIESKIYWGGVGLLEAIDDAPTVDAIEVVRCKDCAVPHNKWTGCPKLSGLVPPPDFYCAYGERKDKMRLIDANALWADFMELSDIGIEFDGEGVANAIANAPTVAAVEVVRCFGCQHFDAVDEMEGGGYCNHPRFHIDNAEPPIVHAADFCSYGERKDNGK